MTCHTKLQACRAEYGANRGRTGGLMNAIHALYQLSYSPINFIIRRVSKYFMINWIKEQERVYLEV